MKSLKKEIIDERIIGLQKKFGFEALFVASGLAFIDLIYKIVFLKKGYMENLDLYFIMIFPWAYFKVRCLFGGAYEPKIKSKFIGKTIGFILAGILSAMVLIGVSNDISVNKIENNIAFYSGIITGVVFGVVLIIFLRYLAKRKRKRLEEE